MKKTVLIILTVCMVMCCMLFAGCDETKTAAGPVDSRTLSLDNTETTAVIGQKPTKLRAILSSGRGAFEWTTSNPEVATVDQEGNVSGVSVGTAVITVKCANLEPATCQVTVVLPGYAPVFTADPTGQGISKTIAVGGSVQLDNSIKFNGEAVEAQITYLSKDTAIAAVSDTGVVTGKTAGTTQIQAVAVYMGLEVHMTVEVTVLPQ